MYEEKLKQILSQAKENYNDKSYTHFFLWADSFNEGEEREIAMMICDFINERNQRPSTLIWRINNFYENEIFKYLSNRIRQKV